MMSVQLPNQIKTALQHLAEGGFSAFLVGGCVRDALMGTTPKDYDITTSALPDEIEQLFYNYTCVLTGKRYGTITVVIEQMPIEITTMRRELGYSDGRRPDGVVFTKDIYEDLARRDFTINAIAYGQDGTIIDPYQGFYHLNTKKIVAVGNANDRFREDGLRILRAIRFASVLDFEIEKNTENSLLTAVDMLDKIAVERVRDELCKALCGVKAPTVLDNYFAVFCKIIPELQPMYGFQQHSKYHNLDVWQHTLSVLSGVPQECILRLAALFHDVGKPHTFTMDKNGRGHFYGHEPVGAEMAKEIMTRLRFSNHQIQSVYDLILCHRDENKKDAYWVRKTMCKLGSPEKCKEVLYLMAADARAKVEDYQDTDEIEHALQLLKQIEKRGDCYCLKMLAVNGDDLLQLGLSAKRVGQALQELLKLVLKNPKLNDKKRLLQHIADKN